MKEIKTVIWLTLAGLGFRIFLYLLFANEIVLGPDQIAMSNLGRNFASGNYYGVLNTYWTPLYPILLGIFTFFTKSVVTSALVISFIAGSLIVPLTFYLVKQSFGRRVALIAAILSIFLPYFINSMFAAGTENIYLVWITGALIVGWFGFRNDSVKDYFIVGILLGLAYLTRPEAIGYLAFFSLTIFTKSLLQKRSPLGLIPAKQIFALLIGFSLLATPYLFYLKKETGIWTISGKVQANTIVGGFEAPVDEENDDPGELGVKSFMKYFVMNLVRVQKSISYVVPSFLFIFIGLGLFSSRWNKRRFLREMYLILFCVLTILGYAAAVVQDRYLYILLPVFLGWIAYGIVKLENWFQKSKQTFLPNRVLELINGKTFIAICLIAVYAYVFPIHFFVRTQERAWEETAYEERDAGLWLQENGNPSALVFSAVLRPVFYSGQSHLPLTTKNIEETLRQIKEKKVDYVITSDRSLIRNPSLKGFAELLENSADFELVYEQKGHPNYKISIFKAK